MGFACQAGLVAEVGAQGRCAGGGGEVGEFGAQEGEEFGESGRALQVRVGWGEGGEDGDDGEGDERAQHCFDFDFDYSFSLAFSFPSPSPSSEQPKSQDKSNTLLDFKTIYIVATP